MKVQVDRIFKKAFRKHFTNHEGNFPPTRPIKLGDYGVMRFGYFERIGFIKDLIHDADFSIVLDDSSSSENFKSSNDISVKSIAKGGVDNAGVVKVNATLQFEFGSSNSVYFSAAGVLYNQIDNLKELGDKIIKAYKDGIWKKDYVVVSRLMSSENVVILISGSSDCKIDVEAGADVPRIDLSNAGINLNIVNSSKASYEITSKGPMTIGMSLTRIHDNLFVKPSIRGLAGGSEIAVLDNTLTNNVAFQDLTLSPIQDLA